MLSCGSALSSAPARIPAATSAGAASRLRAAHAHRLRSRTAARGRAPRSAPDAQPQVRHRARRAPRAGCRARPGWPPGRSPGAAAARSRDLSSMCARRGCAPTPGQGAAMRRDAPWRVDRARAAAAGRAPGPAAPAAADRASAARPHRRRPSRRARAPSGARSACRISGGVCGASEACVALGPQPVADPGAQAAGAAAALIGRGLRDLSGHQPAHARGGIELGITPQSRVDHDANALDGQAGLGDAGRQHDLALARGRGRERRVLGGAGRDRRTAAAPERRGSQRGSSSARCTRPISAAPGRKHRMSPSWSSRARRNDLRRSAARACSSERRGT